MLWTLSYEKKAKIVFTSAPGTQERSRKGLKENQQKCNPHCCHESQSHMTDEPFEQNTSRICPVPQTNFPSFFHTLAVP